MNFTLLMLFIFVPIFVIIFLAIIFFLDRSIYLKYKILDKAGEVFNDFINY